MFQDFGYAFRLLRRSPGFTAVAVLTLALGIGANTAIFSVVNAVLLRPLPYPESDRLLEVLRRYPAIEYPGNTANKFFFIRDHYRSFERVAAFHRPSGFILAVSEQAEHVQPLAVSIEYLRVFGAEPQYGRGFLPEEDRPGGALAAILSHSLWQRRFGSDPNILGQPVSLGGRPYTVVGIMPAGFQSIPPADLWVALQPDPRRVGSGHNYQIVGRLKPGITLAQAQSELDTVIESFRRQYPRGMAPLERARVIPFQSQLARNVQPALLVLLGAVGAVLLIACANMANLLLARASTRAREIAIRAALGAGRHRIVRQLLTESVLLSLAGGGLGVLVAEWAVPALVAMIPPGYALWREVHIDSTVLGVTTALSILTGILFGLAPALEITRLGLAEAFKSGGGRTTSGRRAGRLRHLLVVSQIALCMVLLIGAMLLVRTFLNLRGVNPGFDPRNVLTAQMSLSGDRYQSGAKLVAFYEDALTRIQLLPGVEAAAVINNIPIERGLNLPVFVPDGSVGRDMQITDWRYVTPDYFRIMKIPLVAGRFLGDTDNRQSAPVALVNQEFARRYFANLDPVGRHIHFGDPPREIVGVVTDVKEHGLDVPPFPTVFMTVRQSADGLIQAAHHYFAVSWVVRTRDGVSGLTPRIQEAVRAVDPQQPFTGFRTMESVIAQSLSKQRFQMLLLALFALLALTLAAAGIYGIVSYSVAQRTSEIGIRMALGARARDVVMMMVSRSLLLAGIGVAAGLIGALLLTRTLSTLLFGVSPTDPLVFVLVSAILVGVALVASFIPARRAAKVDPMVALRYE